MTLAFSATPTASLSATDPKGLGLRVEFLQPSDQIAHRIVAFGAENRGVPLLESVETNSATSWPESPVLQTLNLEERGPSSTQAPSPAMLIGAAAHGHWSLSIEPRQAHETAQLVFDVACRVKSLPATLTSSYKIAEAMEAHLSSSALQLSTPLGDFCLQALPLDGNSTQNSCHLTLENCSLQLVRELQPADSPPTTLRWRYQLSARS